MARPTVIRTSRMPTFIGVLTLSSHAGHSCGQEERISHSTFTLDGVGLLQTGDQITHPFCWRNSRLLCVGGQDVDTLSIRRHRSVRRRCVLAQFVIHTLARYLRSAQTGPTLTKCICGPNASFASQNGQFEHHETPATRREREHPSVRVPCSARRDDPDNHAPTHWTY